MDFVDCNPGTMPPVVICFPFGENPPWRHRAISQFPCLPRHPYGRIRKVWQFISSNAEHRSLNARRRLVPHSHSAHDFVLSLTYPPILAPLGRIRKDWAIHLLEPRTPIPQRAALVYQHHLLAHDPEGVEYPRLGQCPNPDITRCNKTL